MENRSSLTAVARRFLEIATFLLIAIALRAAAQATPTPPLTLAAQPNEPAIRSTSELVLLDVVVRDKSGALVSGLSQSDFVVLEDHRKQTISNFEEHTVGSQQASSASPLPPGTYTNSPSYEASQSRTVLLIDALNSKTADLIYARAAILDRFCRLPPGASVAIFALDPELRILQDFTSDPALICKTLGSAPINSPFSTQAGAPMSLPHPEQGDPAQGSILRLRIDTTIDAFKELALYLSALPDRKNLIWISASFPPLVGVPQDTNGITDLSENMKKIDEMFSRARVSVYPVDPRGLMTLPASGPLPAGAGLQGAIAGAYADDLEAPMRWRDQHVTMLSMADATGGRAYFNTNAVGEAIDAAMTDASDYYTIAYVPRKRSGNAAYRRIEVRSTHASYSLTYRHGYFTAAARQSRNATEKSLSPITKALMHGAPPLAELPFTVQQVSTDPSVANSSAATKKHEAGISLEYSIDPHNLQFQPASKDALKAEIEIAEAAYELNGRRVASSDVGLEITLHPNQASKAIQIPQQISLPSGACFLRIAVRDATNGRIGSLEFARPSSSTPRRVQGQPRNNPPGGPR